MIEQKRIDDYASISKEAREAAMRTCWPPVNVRDIYAFGYQDGIDSQSQLIKEKDAKIENLEKSLFGRSTHADVMEHKANKINGYLRDKEKDLVLLREHKAQDQKEIAMFREALVTISKGCPTKAKGCLCLENTALIALEIPTQQELEALAKGEAHESV